jgi:hypothetical protein
MYTCSRLSLYLLVSSRNRIASLLHVHLGVDDDGEGRGAKERIKEQTDAEKFHSFRDVHTSAWHARRNQVAQTCAYHVFL